MVMSVISFILGGLFLNLYINYYAILGCKYGSGDIEFNVDNKNIKTPLGTAHFLEHKMFETESGIDPFKFFSESGVNTNASTTFNNTRYYIWGINDIEKNLSYLLDFVYTPYFTDKNVEKEKGIIKEEILMYEDDPEWALDDEMRKNLTAKKKLINKLGINTENNKFYFIGIINEINDERYFKEIDTLKKDNIFILTENDVKIEENKNICENYSKVERDIKDIKADIKNINSKIDVMEKNINKIQETWKNVYDRIENKNNQEPKNSQASQKNEKIKRKEGDDVKNSN